MVNRSVAMAGRRPRTPPPARTATVVAVIIGTVTALLLIAAPLTVRAHDGDVDAIPPSGSTVDEPIAEIELTFQTEIADDVEIALIDPGDAEIATTATKVSERVAKAEFAPLEQKGTYIVRYLTTATVDGHLLIGAVSFTYGSDAGGSSAASWVLFGIAAIAILAVGAWFSLRNHRRNRDDPGDRRGADPDGGRDSGDVDQDLPDVRV